MVEPRPYRWVVEALLFLIYFAFGLSWIGYAPVLGDLMTAYGASKAQGGALISIVSISKTFVPLLAGVLAARFGLRYAILAGAALSALALVAPYAGDFQQLMVLRFLFGIGGAVVVTLMGAVVMGWFPRSELPMVNAANNVALNTGVVAALFTAPAMSASMGWRSTLVAYGALSCILAVAWLLLGREASTGTGGAKVQDGPSPLGEMLRRKESWYVALAFTGPIALYLALNTWLPTYYQEAFGLDKAAASKVTGLFNLVGIPTAMLGGWLTTKLGLRRPLIITSGLLMPAAAIGMVLATEPTVRYLCAAVLGFSFFLYVAPLFTTPMELPGMDPRKVGVMNGIVFSVAYLGSFFAPIMTGYAKDALGSYVPGFALFAVLSAALALGGFLLPETGPKARVRQEDSARAVAA